MGLPWYVAVRTFRKRVFDASLEGLHRPGGFADDRRADAGPESSDVARLESMRVALNIFVSLLLLSASVYPFTRDSFFLSDRWRPEVGLLFSGTSLFPPATGLLLLAAFDFRPGVGPEAVGVDPESNSSRPGS